MVVRHGGRRRPGGAPLTGAARDGRNRRVAQTQRVTREATDAQGHPLRLYHRTKTDLKPGARGNNSYSDEGGVRPTPCPPDAGSS
jgi:hypothetical protein